MQNDDLLTAAAASMRRIYDEPAVVTKAILVYEFAAAAGRSVGTLVAGDVMPWEVEGLLHTGVHLILESDADDQ